MTAIAKSFAHGRLFWSRLLGLALLTLIAFSAPPWHHESLLALLVEAAGFVLLATATLLRLWCATYIAGLKNQTVMQDGPYSIVRNPLYLSSFIGGLGFGFTTENPLVIALIAVGFIIYYPLVVRHEEKQLEALFDDAYRSYKATVPRWIPRFSGYREPETYLVRARMLRRGYFNAMWFMWAFLLWEIIERFQEVGLLPVFWGGAG
jgi:protein-S-isoprenylcysteine O-methyltransferase Ste14